MVRPSPSISRAGCLAIVMGTGDRTTRCASLYRSPTLPQLSPRIATAENMLTGPPFEGRTVACAGPVWASQSARLDPSIVGQPTVLIGDGAPSPEGDGFVRNCSGSILGVDVRAFDLALVSPFVAEIVDIREASTSLKL